MFADVFLLVKYAKVLPPREDEQSEPVEDTDFSLVGTAD
jgi:hypothetical protein